MIEEKTKFRPIDRFLFFDQGINELREAYKVDDLILKLEALEKIGHSAYHIVTKKYNAGLPKYFFGKSKEAAAKEEKERFKDSYTFAALAKKILMNSLYIFTISNVYSKNSKEISIALASLSLLKTVKEQSDELYNSKEFSEIKEETESEKYLNSLNALSDVIKAIAERSNVVYEDVQKLMVNLTPDSYFLEYEQETLNVN